MAVFPTTGSPMTRACRFVVFYGIGDVYFVAKLQFISRIIKKSKLRK